MSSSLSSRSSGRELNEQYGPWHDDSRERSRDRRRNGVYDGEARPATPRNRDQETRRNEDPLLANDPWARSRQSVSPHPGQSSHTPAQATMMDVRRQLTQELDDARHHFESQQRALQNNAQQQVEQQRMLENERVRLEQVQHWTQTQQNEVRDILRLAEVERRSLLDTTRAECANEVQKILASQQSHEQSEQ
eukprot:6457443-Amphidinium_carterae.1